MIPVIAIDGNNLGMACQFVHNSLSAGDKPTGTIYGMINMIHNILKNNQNEFTTERTRVYVLWDDKRANLWRKEFFPEYKANRDTKPGDVIDLEKEEILKRYMAQMPELKRILSLLGITQLTAKKFEADDIAGWLSKQNDMGILYVTNDKDWLQLVSPTRSVWRPMAQEMITPLEFEGKTGCETTDQFVEMKAISGDAGDNVPGAIGVGEATAIKYLNGELPEKTKAGKPAKKFEKIKEWMEDEDGGYERSLRLVDLRDVDIPPGDFEAIKAGYSEADLQSAFVNLQFNSIMADSEWLDPYRVLAA